MHLLIGLEGGVGIYGNHRYARATSLRQRRKRRTIRRKRKKQIQFVDERCDYQVWLALELFRDEFGSVEVSTCSLCLFPLPFIFLPFLLVFFASHPFCACDCIYLFVFCRQLWRVIERIRYSVTRSRRKVCLFPIFSPILLSLILSFAYLLYKSPQFHFPHILLSLLLSFCLSLM